MRGEIGDRVSNRTNCGADVNSFHDYTNGLTAEQLIAFIVNDYHELSHEKIQNQRDEWKKMCRAWMEKNVWNE